MDTTTVGISQELRCTRSVAAPSRPRRPIAASAQPARLEPLGAAFEVRLGQQAETARLWQVRGAGAGPRVVFVEQDSFFQRDGIYGQAGADYADNARRFAFFTLAALEALPRLAPAPAVLHAHDWHTALAPVYLRTALAGEAYFDAMLLGVANGIEPRVWDPATDPYIAACYSVDDLSGKARCKTALQRAYGLPVRARTPLVGMCARLVAQKGFDLVLGGALRSMPEAQFVFVGQGEERYARALSELAAAARERIAMHVGFTDAREHRLLAGADLLLMPSLYEPCGLTQMRAQRYGTIPVGRRVGGLADTIEDDVTGFLFDEYSPAALERALRRALDRYRDPATWFTYIRAAMSRPFGWERPMAQYANLYARALHLRRPHDGARRDADPVGASRT